MGWKFPDPPNVAAITTRNILMGRDWIAFVFHDEDDGGWQFHGPDGFAMDDAAVVGLGEVWKLDPSIGGVLLSLPLGGRASRDSNVSPWTIEGTRD